MSETSHLYHIVPPRVEGQFLMPLAQLKDEYPGLHEQHAAKYKGREHLMAQTIPQLNCSWNDVIQLSPVPPEQIRDSLKEVGFGWQPMLCFEIDAEEAGINQSNAVFFKNLPRPFGDFTFDSNDFEPFSKELLSSYRDLPLTTQAHFQEAKAASERPMIFLWVPHVLYKGKLAVEKLKIIEIS